MRQQGLRAGTLTTEWLLSCGLTAQIKNPPYRDRIPAAIEYLRQFAVAAAYVGPQGTSASQLACKRRLHNPMHYMCRAAAGTQADADHQPMATNGQVNSTEKPAGSTSSGTTKAALYKVVHDILPTNERLYKYTNGNEILKCADIVRGRIHLITVSLSAVKGDKYGHVQNGRLTWILRKMPKRTPNEWLLRPDFTLWPPKGYRALLWILTSLVIFRTQQQREMTLEDFIDFMRRTKWKLY